VKQLTLILGGSCSGKSRYALEYAKDLGEKKYLLATAQALDEGMATRIEAHKKRRPSDWTTVEESIKVPDVVGFLNRRADVVVIDCITLWLSNLLMVRNNHDLEKEGNALLEVIQRVDYSIVAVSSEVGSGIVPADPISRAFRDSLGMLHQRLAAFSSEVFYMVAGIPMRISGSP
jgi:adenosylcobinamide kinase/adenosylcobinamide-phosphate guanylyltransferase